MCLSVWFRQCAMARTNSLSCPMGGSRRMSPRIILKPIGTARTSEATCSWMAPLGKGVSHDIAQLCFMCSHNCLFYCHMKYILMEMIAWKILSSKTAAAATAAAAAAASLWTNFSILLAWRANTLSICANLNVLFIMQGSTRNSAVTHRLLWPVT